MFNVVNIVVVIIVQYSSRTTSCCSDSSLVLVVVVDVVVVAVAMLLLYKWFNRLYESMSMFYCDTFVNYVVLHVSKRVVLSTIFNEGAYLTYVNIPQGPPRW